MLCLQDAQIPCRHFTYFFHLIPPDLPDQIADVMQRTLLPSLRPSFPPLPIRARPIARGFLYLSSSITDQVSCSYFRIGIDYARLHYISPIHDKTHGSSIYNNPPLDGHEFNGSQHGEEGLSFHEPSSEAGRLTKIRSTPSSADSISSESLAKG